MNQDYEAGDFEFPVIYYDDEKNSNYESDSETGLQIDVAEVNDNERPTKRRRLKVTDMMVLDEVEEELERQLDAKAAKTNLTAINVKNIIKHVITNEHVLAMVNNSIYNSEEAAVFEPKLTRAKAKTRSKLSLSEIPIEAIEKAFVPPDITLDMYDWDNNDKDPAWIGFLNNYTNPEAEVEDDTEADPEYNILEDHDEELFDKEEFRADKAVKIPRKELNDLIAEMVEFVDIYLPESNDATKKKKATDEPETLVQDIPQMETDIPIVQSEPKPIETELSRALDEDFRTLLNIQFQQHIQLMTQHFLMTYKHPKLHSQSVTCEENIDSIKYVAFNIFNLDEALKTVQEWKNQFKDEQFSHGIITKMVHDSVREEELRLKRTRFLPRLHPRLKSFIMGSKALLYPHLLPHQPFSSILKPNVRDNTLSYFPSEVQLLGLGVSEFCPYIESHKRRWKKKMLLMDAAQLIAEYLMPVRKPSALYERIITLRASREPNPVKMYFKTGSIPPKIHYIVEDNVMVEPKYQPLESLPKMWQDYIQNNDREENESYLALMSLLSSSTDNMVIDSSFCTPTVNMLTNTSTRESAGKKSAKQTANSTGNKEDSEAKEGSSSGTTSVQTRKTTPRLAKIRSAQNMKLMTQVSGSKNLSSSNSESIKLNDKEDSAETSQELTGSSKGFRIETMSPKNDILAPQNTKTTPPATPKTYTWKKKFKIKSFQGPFEAGDFL
ncbi:Similar to Gon4l: GON-4-like protein (Mus musculus) [Cotesia congregata]|uniref:Similar to Gon4l: GON-4-like protein (Mus musculus) n=1 Tax=Cotesia congregata TaxID=51543 RepID=A0A8J2HP55_COTCN|nr:Similar to Gon4l: GON-4-like protein (Mus musculus) [Cotesia congregata]